ncbi:membrane protein [Bacillus sp. EB01]|uniref:membrane protein n=1 Tax=Bacillus sp. EB01 TaxID=1347086 RepID=UPI0005C456CF|nr:membrane protein [Bacillus sp. EB01]
MIQQTSGNETNIKLPFAFILIALVSLVTSQVLLIVNGDMVSEGVFRIPAIWSAAHLLLLGWALMTAMGAVYQLVPVAFLTPIWSEKFGFVQFAVTAIGITLFSLMLYVSPGNAFLPGVLMLIGILMFIFQMGMTLRKQAKPNILTLFVGSALVCLLVTIILGITMVWSMKTGSGGDAYIPILKSHILLGTAGWFTLLIFGFSYKMVPMFSLAHGFGMKMAAWVYAVYTIGLVVTAISFWTGNDVLLGLGLALLAIGFMMFAWHILQIIGKRIKKKLDKPFMFALLGILFGALVHLASLVSFSAGSLAETIGPLLYVYIMLWIAYSILGYLYKIVPFLWWTHKYSKEIGKTAVPALKDMVNDKAAVPLFITLAASSILVFFALLYKSTVVFLAGQIAASITLVIISITIILVLEK